VQTASLVASVDRFGSPVASARGSLQRADGGQMDEEISRQVESKSVARAEESAEGYGRAVSDAAARAQSEQEARVAQQLRQKTGARKGSLPVHIAIPGGVASLPRVTVSRMLLIGRDDNFFTIRAYPSWLGALLGLLQPALIAGTGLLFGLILSGLGNRRLLGRAAIPAALALVVLIAALAWASVFAYRRLQRRALPAAS